MRPALLAGGRDPLPLRDGAAAAGVVAALQHLRRGLQPRLVAVGRRRCGRGFAAVDTDTPAASTAAAVLGVVGILAVFVVVVVVLAALGGVFCRSSPRAALVIVGAVLSGFGRGGGGGLSSAAAGLLGLPALRALGRFVLGARDVDQGLVKPLPGEAGGEAEDLVRGEAGGPGEDLLLYQVRLIRKETRGVLQVLRH